MKMKKTIAAVTAGMIALGAMVSVSAAGVGFVNFNAALQAHPKTQKAELDLENAVKKGQQTFDSKSAGKTDQEKQQILNEVQKDLAQKKNAILQPIYSDVMKAIQAVRKEQNLDIIVDQAAVIDGGVDVTAAVAQKLAK